MNNVVALVPRARDHDPTESGPSGESAAVDRLYTVEQAAERLNTTQRFVRRLIAQRRIPFHKVGRYVRLAESDLTRFVHEGRVEVAELTWPLGHGVM